jgi:hypothetical protein
VTRPQTPGRRIAVAYATSLSAAAVNALAERIDRAIVKARKAGRESALAGPGRTRPAPGTHCLGYLGGTCSKKPDVLCACSCRDCRCAKGEAGW